MTFNNWLDTFVHEKGLDLEHEFEVDGKSGWNLIPLECVIEAIKTAPKQEQQAIKAMLVKIDFAAGDVMNYFGHLAQAIAM